MMATLAPDVLDMLVTFNFHAKLAEQEGIGLWTETDLGLVLVLLCATLGKSFNPFLICPENTRW